MLEIPSRQKEKIDALMSQVVFGFNAAKLDGLQQVRNITAVVVRAFAPNSVPAQVGWVWVDTASGVSYISIGTTNVSDWAVLGNIGGSVVDKKIAVGSTSGDLTSYTALGYDTATGILTFPIANASTEYRVSNTKVVGARQTAAYTSDPETSAYTGIDNTQAGTPYAQLSDLNQLRVAYEALRAGYENLRTALQNHGLIN